MSKLTMAEVKQALAVTTRKLQQGLYAPDMEQVGSLIQDLTQALIESQLALRSVCLGCSRGWKIDSASPLSLHEVPVHDIHYQMVGGYSPCRLTRGQVAALLPEARDGSQ